LKETQENIEDINLKYLPQNKEEDNKIDSNENNNFKKDININNNHKKEFNSNNEPIIDKSKNQELYINTNIKEKVNIENTKNNNEYNNDIEWKNLLFNFINIIHHILKLKIALIIIKIIIIKQLILISKIIKK